LNNYMETNSGTGKIPWDDLKYLFGEIMYGGHVVDGLDRRYVSSCLDNLMQDALLEEKELFPYIDGKGITFKSPQATTYDKYLEYIQVECPGETPLAFGMHPNAEIDFRTKQCIYLFGLLNELAPKDSAGGDGGAVDPVQEKVLEFMHTVSDTHSLDTNKINIEDVTSKIDNESRTPYQNVFI